MFKHAYHISLVLAYCALTSILWFEYGIIYSFLIMCVLTLAILEITFILELKLYKKLSEQNGFYHEFISNILKHKTSIKYNVLIHHPNKVSEIYDQVMRHYVKNMLLNTKKFNNKI